MLPEGATGALAAARAFGFAHALLSRRWRVRQASMGRSAQVGEVWLPCPQTQANSPAPKRARRVLSADHQRPSIGYACQYRKPLRLLGGLLLITARSSLRSQDPTRPLAESQCREASRPFNHDAGHAALRMYSRRCAAGAGRGHMAAARQPAHSMACWLQAASAASSLSSRARSALYVRGMLHHRCRRAADALSATASLCAAAGAGSPRQPPPSGAPLWRR